ncbi:hypothetical protein BFW01_g8028 [Lasiodiplodia theobromae]|nr:hypothetical protein BFW01_g8028 [Lasiodiplodia theobromae]
MERPDKRKTPPEVEDSTQEPSQSLPKRSRTTAYISTTSTAAFMPLPALPPRTISPIPSQTAIASIPRPASLPARPSTIVPPHNQQLPTSQVPSQLPSNGVIPLPPSQRLIPRNSDSDDARPAFPEFHADKLSIRDIVPGLLAHLPWNGASWSRHPVLVLSFHPATGYANCLKATSFQDRPGAIAAKVAEFETQEDKDRFLAGFVLVEDAAGTPPHNSYPVLRLEEGWLVKTTYVDVRRGSMECVHFSELRRLRSGGVFLTPRVRRADVEALRLDLANGSYA